MAREDWRYINLDKGLIDEVDVAVEKIKWYKEKKYADTKHFISIAIRQLLEKEGVKMEVAAK
jgi:hypothetical protein